MALNLREVSTAPQFRGAPLITPRQKHAGYAMAVASSALFSLKAVIIKLAYAPAEGEPQAALEPIVILMLRMGFAVPVYIAILIYALRAGEGYKLSLRPVLAAIGLGALGYYLCALLDFTGLVYITAQLERLLLFTYPVFVLILGALFFGVKVSRSGIGAIFIAYLGLAVIFAGGDIASGKNVVLGSALVLGCAVLFASFQIFAKPVIDRIGSRLFTCIAMISASTTVLLHFLLSRAVMGESVVSALSLPPRVIILGAVLGICCTVIPSFLMNIAIGRVGAQAVATLGMISPILTIVAAVYVLGEPFGVIDGFGTLLTIAGIGLFTYFDKNRAKGSQPPPPKAR